MKNLKTLLRLVIAFPLMPIAVLLALCTATAEYLCKDPNWDYWKRSNIGMFSWYLFGE